MLVKREQTDSLHEDLLALLAAKYLLQQMLTKAIYFLSIQSSRTTGMNMIKCYV
jgi:hypothetical protein